MMRHSIARLEAKERDGRRPPGYVAAVVAAGRLVIDAVRGDYVELTPAAHAALCAIYRPAAPPGQERICLRDVRIEAYSRTPGFGESVLMLGKLSGGFVYIERAAYLDLQRRHPLLALENLPVLKSREMQSKSALRNVKENVK